MAGYIVKRLLLTALVLWVVSIIVFSAVRLIPGDVCRIVVGQPDVKPEQCRAIKADLGLDKPVFTQYVRYMGGVLHGDFGRTLLTRRSVWQEIRGRIPLTLELTLLSTLFAIVLALPIGVISSIKRESAVDYGLRFLTIGWLSIPGFWIGTMLIIFPAKWWGYSPPVGYTELWKEPLKNLSQLYLPAIALALPASCVRRCSK